MACVANATGFGVSAVLANVTVAASANGGIRMFPKPPRTSVFADQSSFPAANTQPGVAFFTVDSRLRYGHFVWHLFVIGGTTCHFFAVLFYAA